MKYEWNNIVDYICFKKYRTCSVTPLLRTILGEEITDDESYKLTGQQ
jgi:hypothetical protein